MKIKRAKHRVLFATIVLLCTISTPMQAQYYDWGQNPASIKWFQIETENGKFVFPDSYTTQAIRLIHYMDTISTKVGYGYRHGPMKLPLVMHTQNFQSNGIVMLAPNRMEFIVTPPVSTYATPWLKQLAIHEYRHSVQYNNLNRGMIKGLSYLLGQQGSLIGLAFMPLWAVEGDAVLTETQFTTFGRGLQPSFTIDYRAMALEGEQGKKGRKKGYTTDKYFGGSYVDNIPSHYHVGYQIASYAYTRYGENIWDKVTWYGARNPYLLITSTIALKKFYKTSSTQLFKQTFEDLNSYWRSLPLESNSAQIVESARSSFTTYSSPISLSDSTIIAIKDDFDRSTRIVEINLTTAQEKTLLKTGAISTGLTLSDSILVWSEYRTSTFWAQRVNSVECRYNLATKEQEVVRARRTTLFPVAMRGGNSAYVEYDYSGRYSINHEQWRVEIPDTISLYGLAHDDKTNRFYFIGLSDGGMWIGATGESELSFEQITTPSYSSLSNLRASGGRLYYNSIASGKDEAHLYDIASGVEYRLTNSRYGSFSPSPLPSDDGERRVVVTTYTPDGYLVAVQRVDSSQLRVVEHSELPLNIVNPPRAKWDVPNLDKISASAERHSANETTPEEISASEATPEGNSASETTLQNHKPKRYRKGAHPFRFHSWAPVYFRPDELISEADYTVDIGVTLLSQNLLNSTFTTLSYRYTDAGSLFAAGIRYHGLAPKFEVKVEYGTMKQSMYRSRGETASIVGLKMKNHFKVEANIYLPILISSGYHIHRLTPFVQFEHINSKLIYGGPTLRLRSGLQKLRSSLTYTYNIRMAYRDFLPRLGYAVRVTNTINPFNSKMGKIWSLYLRGYLPGVAQHHSLMIRAVAQHHNLSTFNFRQKELFPRGADYSITPKRYVSTAVDYQLPIWYPDGGIPSLLYFRRIRANLKFDYARYKGSDNRWRNTNSYGIDILFDIVPIRMSASANTVIIFTLDKPSNRRGVVIGGSFILPF